MKLNFVTGEGFKVVVVAVLLAGVVGLLIYFHVFLKRGIILTHSFYIPVVLAAFWWKRKGLAVAGGLGVFLIGSSLLFLPSDVPNNVKRAIMFVVVGFVIATLREVVAQKEEELSQSETRYRTLFENIGDGVAIYEATNDGDDFVFVDFNRAGESIDNIPRDQVMGKSVVDVFPRIRVFGLLEVFRRVWKTGRSEHVPISEYQDERVRGWRENFVYKLPSGEIVAVYRDETERRRAEERIKHLNAVLRAVRNVNQLITKETDPEKLIKGACDNLIETRGYSNAWIVLTDKAGSPVKWAESDGNDSFTAMIETLQRGGFIRCVEIAISHSGVVLVDNTITQCMNCPLADTFGSRGAMSIRLEHGGKIFGVLCVSIPKYLVGDEEEQSLFEEVADDIAFALHSIEVERDRLEMERTLRKRTMALERSNQELEKFAYVASHDLQEPLRMVSSYMQLLSRRYKGTLDSDADEFIDFAVDGAKRMQILIDDLLSYSRIETRGKTFESINSEDALGLALVNLLSLIEESGATVTHDTLPIVEADKTQLGQLFQNLIGNAIKFKGRDVPHVHVSAEKDGNQWVFTVRDNGIGIDPKYGDRIFEIFQRLHGRGEYSGTGIGLAVCKKIVERHGGRIWVDSIPGNGAAFHFTVPEKQEAMDLSV